MKEMNTDFNTELLSRRGTFMVQREAIMRNPSEVSKIFSGMVIYRAELMFDTDSIKYEAIAPQFDPVPMGVAAPPYKAVITTNNDTGKSWANWEKA